MMVLRVADEACKDANAPLNETPGVGPNPYNSPFLIDDKPSRSMAVANLA